MEIVCPAGTPAALRAAVKAGAHTVYCGFADETNARNFPGLNFERDEMRESIARAHEHGAKVLIAINTYPRAGAEALWHRAVADPGEHGADAIILADPGLLSALRRAEFHRSPPSLSAGGRRQCRYHRISTPPNSRVKRVVLPRVLSVPEIAAINAETDVETEVFVFGGLCVMAEGRCSLSSYARRQVAQHERLCSPHDCVRIQRRPGRLRCAARWLRSTAWGRAAPIDALQGAVSRRATRPGCCSKTPSASMPRR
ncbi:MAG: peptidase U32 family protein [Paracoccaceae bacterium]